MDYVIAGAVAGLVSDGIVHPIDTIRARLQVQSSTRGVAAYKSATDALVQIARQEGVRAGLYRGFGAVAAGTVPGHALYFAAYEACKEHLGSWMLVKKNNIGGGDANGVNGDAADKAREVVLHLTSGFVADVFGSLVWSPMDVVKQRVMVARKMQKVAVAGASAGTLSGTATAPAAPAYTSSYNAFLTIIREEGPRGLYRGFGAGLATYGPYVSIYFALYEQWKAMFRRDELLFFNAIVNPFYGRGDADRLPFYVYLSGAAGSAALSAVVTTPLDVVKTRIQVHGRRTATTTTPHDYSTWTRALGTILREDGGWRALFKGVKPRALWMSSGTAITMLVYEEFKAVLDAKPKR